MEIDGAAVVRVRRGMTMNEVIRILGVPPGDYTTKKVTHLTGVETVIGAGPISKMKGPRGTPEIWSVNSKYIVVWFWDGKVDQISCEPAEPVPPKSLIQEIGDTAAELRTALGW